MRSVVFAVTVSVLAVSAASAADAVHGEYLEARNADVWTGPCFANAEIGIVGDKAVMAWKVDKGVFNDVRLDGLSVLAVVAGDDTFGIGRPVRTRAVLIVDRAGDARQQAALIAMVKSLAGDTIQEIVGVRVDDIQMSTSYCDGKGCAFVESKEVRVKTRCLGDHDAVCTNEAMYYPPLSRVQGEYAAFTERNEYVGKELGTRFIDNDVRSAVIARFAM